MENLTLERNRLLSRNFTSYLSYNEQLEKILIIESNIVLGTILYITYITNFNWIILRERLEMYGSFRYLGVPVFTFSTSVQSIWSQGNAKYGPLGSIRKIFSLLSQDPSLLLRIYHGPKDPFIYSHLCIQEALKIM